MANGMFKGFRFVVWFIVAQSSIVSADIADLLTRIAPPAFSTDDIPVVYSSSQHLVSLLQPVLQNRLAETNYDRAHVIEQFLDHYDREKSRHPNITPLDAFATFCVDLSLGRDRGGPCIALALDAHAHLPPGIHGYIAAVALPPRFEQLAFPPFCHAAVLIRFQNPNHLQDCGYIILDPSFDFANPIVVLDDGTPFPIDAREKGAWVYRRIDDVIVCKSQPSEGQAAWPEEDPRWFTMIYRTDRLCNPVQAAALPMILADRRYSLLSRRADGSHLAHLNVELDREQVIWDDEQGRREPISFTDFTSEYMQIDADFERKLFLQHGEANRLISRIIHAMSVLDRLYCDYLLLLHEAHGAQIVPGFNLQTVSPKDRERLASISSRLDSTNDQTS
jgi:hypothetical protein